MTRSVSPRLLAATDDGVLARAQVIERAAGATDSSPAAEASERRVWLLEVDGEDVGVLEADRVEDTVSLRVYVREEHRRRSIARGAVGRLLGMAPWGHSAEYAVVIDQGDVAAEGLARSTGFRVVGEEPDRRVWARASPRPRHRGDDIRRFFGAEGRIDRYPTRPQERAELLAWVAARVVAPDEVLSEPALNDRLRAYDIDVARIRRFLVDAGMLDRTTNGAEYRRPAEI